MDETLAPTFQYLIKNFSNWNSFCINIGFASSDRKHFANLVERFANIPDKEIGTKYTKDLGIEWLRQLAYKSIAVADLLDKKDNDNNGDKKS